MKMTIVYLIRHAHADWYDDDARPLSAAGFSAAQLVANQLASQPIVAIYSSPSRRSLDTVMPLANRLGFLPELVQDLRERELPAVPPADFDQLVLEAWRSPDSAPPGGESNVQAQARGLSVLRTVLMRHLGEQVVVGTHGNLLTLLLNGMNSTFGYDFWRRLSFPDIYRLAFDDGRLVGVDRLWHEQAA